VTKNRY